MTKRTMAVAWGNCADLKRFWEIILWVTMNMVQPKKIGTVIFIFLTPPHRQSIFNKWSIITTKYQYGNGFYCMFWLVLLLTARFITSFFSKPAAIIRRITKLKHKTLKQKIGKLITMINSGLNLSTLPYYLMKFLCTP